MTKHRLPPGEFLRRRNALWRELRQLEPDAPRFADALAELERLTHYPRHKLLEGLGLTADET